MNAVMDDREIIDRVTDALEAAVAERGANWIYPVDDPAWMTGEICRYQLDDGSPACLVGLAARKINPKIQMTRAMNICDVLGAALGIDRDWIPLRLWDAVGYAQSHQDEGCTWGESLEIYYKILNAHEEVE